MKLQTLTEYVKDHLLAEGFTIKDKVFSFNPTKSGILNTTFGKGKNKLPRVSKLVNGNAFAIYNKQSSSNKDEFRNLLKALKKKEGYSVDSVSYKLFLKRSALYFNKLITEFKPDYIITVDSKSELIDDILKYIKPYLSPGLVVTNYSDFDLKFKNVVRKVSNINDIRVNRNKLGTISDKAFKRIQSTLNQMKIENYFQMKKILPRERKGFEEFLEIDEKFISTIQNKRIIVIEDFITSGTTIKEISKQLEKIKINELMILTLLKE